MSINEQPQYVQLETGDDAASVRDRLSFMRGGRVVLIWPEHGTVLARKLDLVLVQREAARQSIRLALVTHDAEVLRNARELDISAFETLKASEKSRWKRARSRFFVSRSDQPAPVDTEALMPYASRIFEEAPTPTQQRLRMIGRALVLIALLVLIGILGVLLIPSATIILVPAGLSANVDAEIIADPTLSQAVIDVENGIIPAILLRAELEERGTLPTTGVQSLSTVPAIGTVTLINRTSNAVQIPAGALVSSSAGTPILFRTLTDAALPAGDGESADVGIEAVPESAGLVGNVDTGLINTIIGPLAETVEVRNFAPTVGGEIRSTQIVTPEDQERLTAVLRQQLQGRAYQELLSRLTQAQFLIPETIRIEEERDDWKTFDFALGEATDALTLTMRAVVSVTVVDETLAQTVAYARLGAQVARGRQILPQSIVYTRGAVLGLDGGGRVRFTFNAQAEIAAHVDEVGLRERLTGRTVEEAIRYLAAETDLTLGTTPQLTVSPAWFGRLPLLGARITIQTRAVEAVEIAPPENVPTSAAVPVTDPPAQLPTALPVPEALTGAGA